MLRQHGDKLIQNRLQSFSRGMRAPTGPLSSRPSVEPGPTTHASAETTSLHRTFLGHLKQRSRALSVFNSRLVGSMGRHAHGACGGDTLSQVAFRPKQQQQMHAGYSPGLGRGRAHPVAWTLHGRQVDRHPTCDGGPDDPAPEGFYARECHAHPLQSLLGEFHRI